MPQNFKTRVIIIFIHRTFWNHHIDNWIHWTAAEHINIFKCVTCFYKSLRLLSARFGQKKLNASAMQIAKYTNTAQKSWHSINVATRQTKYLLAVLVNTFGVAALLLHKWSCNLQYNHITVRKYPKRAFVSYHVSWQCINRVMYHMASCTLAKRHVAYRRLISHRNS